METRLYSTTQAAKFCRVTAGTIIHWIEKGRLRTALTAGGHRRISDTELLRLIKQLRLPIPAELQSRDHLAQKNVIKILVVDDETSVREMIRWLLKESFPNIKTEAAEDGLAAGWKTTTFHPDLILLDLMMPGLDGFRFCELVRTSSDLKNARIIAVSGVQGFGFEEKIRRLGANDFLAKPFEAEILREKILEQLKIIAQEKNEGISWH